MDTAVDRRTETSAGDVVVLVHGTYAARDADEGDDWWQRGSQAWNGLRDRLPAGVELPEQGRLFHWSGENSERARIKAAGDLLTYLMRFESEGRRYHLIGHSHGGSVIWHALRLATLQQKSLDSLQSWSTVGTPFLHHRTRGAWHFANIFNLVLAVFLLRPAVWTLCRFVQLVGSAVFGYDHGVRLPTDGGTGWYAATRTPALKIVEWLGVPVTETAEGIRVGSFDAGGGQSFLEYLFLSPEGWLILVVALVAAYVYLNLAVFLLSPVLESVRIRKEKRLEQNAMDAFRGRWLGIWTSDDEAINGLRATLDLSISFVARMAPRESVLFSDRLSLISRPYHYLLAPVYNAVFRPLLDGIVRSHVVKTAQGNNRPSAEVVAVSPVPIHQDELQQLPVLPEWLREQITDKANRHARDIAPKLRTLLAEPSFATGLEAFGAAISGQELVHTSYFDHAEIMDLLAMHVAWGRGDSNHLVRIGKQHADLLSWLRQFKARMGEGTIARSTNVTATATRHRPRLRRRTPRRSAA